MGNEPRKHCIFPKRGPFYTCFNSNLVIEPDTSWLGSIKDKPIYDADGNKVSNGNSGGQSTPDQSSPTRLIPGFSKRQARVGRDRAGGTAARTMVWEPGPWCGCREWSEGGQTVAWTAVWP